MIEAKAHADGAVFPVRAQPGTKRSKILGERNGALRVAVTAPPDQGKANAALVEAIADALGCKASQVELVSGQAHRDKRFLIRGMGPAELELKLAGLVKISDSSAATTEKRSKTP
ncbi:DUF167 domain-containing protein [Isosphaeraceae bacterium EP7]